MRAITSALTLPLALALVLTHAVAAAAQSPALRVPSRPDTVVWGEIPIDRPAVATIKSGQTVTVDTISHQGATQDEAPEAFLERQGIARSDVLRDASDFWRSRGDRPREGRAGHILTGPINVEGAEPGDMLEIEIVDLRLRTPFGMNSSGPQSGVLASAYPGTRTSDTVPYGSPRVIRTGMSGGKPVAFVNESIAVPLQPFMGIMAVAPPRPTIGMPGITVDGVQTTRPPGPFGGNLDFKISLLARSCFSRCSTGRRNSSSVIRIQCRATAR